MRFSKRASICCERVSIRSMRASARFARSSAAAWLAATAARMASIFWKRRSTSCSISFSSLAPYLLQRHQRLADLRNDVAVLFRRRFGQENLETLAGVYPVTRHFVDQPEVQLRLHQIGI